MQNQKSNQKSSNSQIVKSIASNIGFDFCGIAPANKLAAEKKNYMKWLSMGCQGKMKYLEKNLNLRFEPAAIFENSRSVISLAVNYFPEKFQNPDSNYKISKYAYIEDYHLVLKNKLSLMLELINQNIGSVNGRGFVDSAPVPEKPWAQKAGLGWIGKNGCLLIPKHGSYFFLCELIVDKELEYDKPFEKNYCGNCTRCIDKCPTNAIDKDGFVNAKKCISYLTIELKDHIEKSLVDPGFKSWIFGCDICQDVCPWNRFAKTTKKNLFRLNDKIIDFDDNNWEDLTREQYLAYIRKSNSPISRIKFDKLKSNINYVKKGISG